MYRKLLRLEFKNFFRNPQLSANIAMKIFMGFGIIYFSLAFIGAAFGLFFFVRKELNADPVQIFCRYFIYYWAADLLIRYMLQQMPTQNIKPFLTQNITKKKLVLYTIIKTISHFFNWAILLFLIPFCALMLYYDYSIIGTIGFFLGIFSIILFNNFLNILLNGKTLVLVITSILIFGLAALEYFGIFAISNYSELFFYSLYNTIGAFVIPLALLFAAMYLAFKSIYDDFYLDQGLELKKAEGKTENIEFLNKFGVIGTFLNNDIRLLKRSKAAKQAVFGSLMFLCYGLLIYTPGSFYQSDFMKFFCGLFVTGGFVFMFAQKVPAWDSSYYPLMMTQNVPYKQYLKAKWSLVVVAVLLCMVVSTAYIILSWEFYLIIFAGGLYNIGVNSYLTLISGAYNKQPIDLNSKAKSMGGKNNFNIKLILMMLPQMLLPMAVFSGMKYFFGMTAAIAAIGFLGLIGFLLRDKIFDYIVKIYKTEKYTTIEAFKKTE
ncbi:DUF5687 family protein [Frigoriflavimonas asaccharolytica]|uniref:ABC-type multidrug transport system fused ATPase/permease subunit n=1 Tax=Frigoriflavimonas asaccharolytica TaxID=2735899 RepID=A0A8J8K660_9FLAO|nr:DUF5687 family protein [Frigoriflavimonas asaccharolytica]NRS93375.1 ABC-type multidrug transport system fused ATPase/permease subunit [Frigoriflavimonas asaccharolytica]